MKRRLGEDDSSEAKRSRDNTKDEFQTDPIDEEVLNLENECDDPFEDELEEEVIEENGNDEMEDDTEENEAPARVWRPGVDSLEEGEQLDYESSAYDMFHRLNVEWPCLSFDIIKDKLGFQRTKYPHTMYMAAGTQAAEQHANKILILKISDLHRTKHDDDNSDDSDDESFDDDPILQFKSIKHKGAVNRLRVMPQKPNIVGTWSELGVVNLWDISSHLKALNQPQDHSQRIKDKPLHSFSGHPQEGYAIDWSPVSEGRLATGDCTKYIYLWNYAEGKWEVDLAPYVGHTDSVEDIQWSPTEAGVFASCSVDKTIKIWDARKKERAALSVEAHKSDVNVISWNHKVNHVMLSGSDDGSFKTWDLRNFSSNNPTASFTWHNQPITSLEWSPLEESVLVVSSADNQVTLWDLSLEADKEEDSRIAPELEVPPQLLFVHQGQTDPKEVHWHPQIPGVLCSTSYEGFNVFKTINSYGAEK